MSEIAIRAEGLGKTYRIGEKQPRYRTLRDTLSSAVPRLRRRSSGLEASQRTFEALKDVSLEIKQGEVVGVIGHNGAGKSTLLKILARITEPTTGHAEIRGRLASLLEVGTGFHHELTGRENVYLNAAILGMPRAETARKFDDIVAFAEIDKFIDTPVKYYSSGMYLRLAFAVAAHLDPDIILVDEVLAVGDARFQEKCLNKMHDVSQQGRTVLFVSHNMPAVARLCERVILIDAGTVAMEGPSAQVVSAYLRKSSGSSAASEWTDASTAPGRDVAIARAVRVRNDSGAVTEAFDIRHPVRIEIEYDVLKPGCALSAHFALSNADGRMAAVETDPQWRGAPRPVGRYVTRAVIPGNLLNEGSYFVSAGVFALSPFTNQFWVRNAAAFEVVDPLQGDSARGAFEGEMRCLVRPLLQWSSETTSAP
jgi:lipopolysaccharide transport system ATP-binding protein